MWDFWLLDGHCQQGDSFSHGWIKGTTFCLVDRIFFKVLICAVNFFYHHPWLEYWTSPVAQMVKNLPAMQETRVRSSIPGSGRSPEERSGNPLQYSRLENFMEKRSLVGSPWDCKELDMTERLSLSLE